MNAEIASHILSALGRLGVRTVCLCAGARNAPFVARLDAGGHPFDVLPFCEERSAAFFALGRIRRDGRPAAVITTSGTAAAELLPAVIEACYSGLPLVAVTADRPQRLRHTGAPQTVPQPPMFAAFVRAAWDIDASAPSPGMLPLTRGPIHLNVCFEEPLGADVSAAAVPEDAAPPDEPSWMDGEIARREVASFFGAVRCPLVMVSSLDAAHRDWVKDFLRRLGAPLHLEAISGLRESVELAPFALRSGEKLLHTPALRGICDGVLRLGGVPTARFWRDLDDLDLPVLSVGQLPFPGLARTGPAVPLDLFRLLAPAVAPCGRDWSDLARLDESRFARLQEILDAEPRSEPAWFRHLDGSIPDDARVLLGNSLPIREWDLCAPRRPSDRILCANRGANGIDGLVSTALGLASADRPAWGLLGDLSALYDLAGLWPSVAPCGPNATLAVINNGGGQIFSRMFPGASFRNEHTLRFKAWADLFGWDYRCLTTPVPPSGECTPGGLILEILPDPAATRRFWQAWDAAWA